MQSRVPGAGQVEMEGLEMEGGGRRLAFRLEIGFAPKISHRMREEEESIVHSTFFFC